MKIISAYLCIILLCFSSCSTDKAQSKSPNFIIIFTDDQGYQDMGSYGSTLIKTPNLDRMASEGIRLTDFYVSMSVCSASRASLLTGQYSYANGVGGVYFPDNKGMDSSNVILPEILNREGYKTACIGKWHLGDLSGSLPVDQGFDEYFGIPYSNDMYVGYTQTFAKKVKWNLGYNLEKAKADQDSVELYKKNRKRLKELGLRDLVPLMEGNQVIEYPAEQGSLTKRYFDRAMQFIDQSNNDPFLIYLTPAMPHVPLFASKEFEGKSKRGLYGDVIEEIDYYTGKLLDYLKSKGLAENTFVIYTSDNGPWLGKGNAAGSAEPLRDGKFSRYDGGVRVPSIMWWPGTIPAGVVSSNVISTLDFVPTISNLAKANISNLELHGYDITEFLKNPNDHPLSNSYLYMDNKEIAGIRKGAWKYLRYSGKRNAEKDTSPELYNLTDDISEENNLAISSPEIIARLEEEIQNFQKNKR